MGKVVEIDCEKSMKLQTSRNVTKSKRSLHWCRSISKKYLCTFYYSISQKVITLSGRRFITVPGVLLHYRAVITLSGVFYYIIGQLLQYRAFITLSVGTSVNEKSCWEKCFLNHPLVPMQMLLDPFPVKLVAVHSSKPHPKVSACHDFLLMP